MMQTSDKICLVTGGTSGIGAAAAQQLAHHGLTVVLVGRNAAKCQRQVQKIRRAAKGAHVDFIQADLSSQTQIRDVAGEFQKRYSHLDVLINNAGAIFSKRFLTVDGLEMTFALNHLSYFLLTSLLLDQLKASTSGRVIVVSSAAHEQGYVNFEDLQMEHCYDRVRAYAQSKLANLLFTYALARRLEGTRITANALNPGSVTSNFGANNGWLRTRLRNLLVHDMISCQEGAKTVVYLATSKDVEGVTCEYYYKCKPIRSSDASHDAVTAEQLWHLSERLSGLTWCQPDGIPAVDKERCGTSQRLHQQGSVLT